MLDASPKNAHVPTRNWTSARSGIPVAHSVHLLWFECGPSNPHSQLGIADHRGISRGFLPWALSNTCPISVVGTHAPARPGQVSNKAKHFPTHRDTRKQTFVNVRFGAAVCNTNRWHWPCCRGYIRRHRTAKGWPFWSLRYGDDHFHSRIGVRMKIGNLVKRYIKPIFYT